MSAPRDDVPENSPVAAHAGSRPIFLWTIKLAVTLAAFAFVVSRAELGAAFARLSALPSIALAGAELAVVCSMLVGAARHRALLVAYGAVAVPSLLECLRLYWAGFFFNTFLPGSVGGDVLRAVEARTAFGDAGGSVASAAVVFVERLLGLAALALVAGAAFLLRPLPGVEGLFVVVVIGMSGAVLGVVAVAGARRVGGRAPGALGVFLRRLPEVRSPTAFAGAMGLSLASQALVIATGHALVGGLGGGVSFVHTASVVPVGAAAAYFPLTVSGLGVREAAFEVLFERVGMPGERALAFAFAFLAVQWAGALVGGIVALFPAPQPAK